jgi:hypothetical protein
MERPIEDHAHPDIGFMILDDDGELLEDIVQHLGYLYDMYHCYHDVTPSMLFMHPEDYELFCDYSGAEEKIIAFEDATIEVDMRVPRWNYYYL